MDNKKQSDVIQPMPKDGFNVSYICRYESEIDRQIIIDSMGHYIKAILGTLDIVFIKVPMEAINKAFKLNQKYPGEEIEYNVDHRKNNLVRYTNIVGDDLPPLWAVMTNEEVGLNIITTIEPCKFIMRTCDIAVLDELMAKTEIAPKEYNYAALDMVHWDDDTCILKRDLEFFVAGKKFFDSRNMAYSRSYLLHGPPGNGKTTTIKAISKFLNAKPESFDFSAQMNSPDKQFQDWVLGESERIGREEDDDDEVDVITSDDESNTHTPIRLLVLEDIDRLFPRDGSRQTAVTLQAVLQALDGATPRRNTIIVATANEPKALDQKVLARPGRFDKQIFYSQPSEEAALKFLKKLFEGEEVTDDVLRNVCKKLRGHSYAFHKELFATSASYAIERASHLINDDDVLKGIEDLLKHIDTFVMKSETTKLGFGG